MSKYAIILFLFSTTIDIKAQQNSLNEDTLLSKSYFQQHQIHTITFISLIELSWMNGNPAFDPLMNARFFKFDYNANGLCTQMSWMFCHWDTASLQLDTSMASIENFFYFTYTDSLISNIDILSFSKINNVQFKYSNHIITRKISTVEQSGEVKIKTDSTLHLIKYTTFKNPYEFAIFPTLELQNISTLYEKVFLINQTPSAYFDNELKGKMVLIELCPIMAVFMDVEP